MKENNYISVLDGLLRAKIYLWMIGVLFYVKSIYVVEFFLLAGIFLMGVSILCSSAINRKRWITSWMISFCACFIYLICYILAGYAGLVIPMGEILEADQFLLQRKQSLDSGPQYREAAQPGRTAAGEKPVFGTDICGDMRSVMDLRGRICTSFFWLGIV